MTKLTQEQEIRKNELLNNKEPLSSEELNEFKELLILESTPDISNTQTIDSNAKISIETPSMDAVAPVVIEPPVTLDNEDEIATKCNDEPAEQPDEADGAKEPGYYNFKCTTCGAEIVKMKTILRDGMIVVIMPGAKSLQAGVEEPKFGERPYCKICNTNVDLSL